MKRLLLHSCCAGCAAYVAEILQFNYQVVLFFYNPNIFPEKEYRWREEELTRIARIKGWSLIKAEYNYQDWLQAVKGFETEPERGHRCSICFKFRLTQTFQEALRSGFSIVATTLSISPHKSVEEINRAGLKLRQELGIDFLVADFKKGNGFQKSCQLASQLVIRRQNYCGCEFSRR